MQKLEEATRRGNRKVSAHHYMSKTDANGGGKTQEKKCSQNFKINSLIVPGIIKNLQISKHLKVFHIVHYQFSQQSWEELSEALGQSKTLSCISFNVCNLNVGGHIEILMQGLYKNSVIEKLDLSDNDLSDIDGVSIVKFLKLKAEERDSALWMTGLRQNNKQRKKSQHRSIDGNDYLFNLIMSSNSPYHAQKSQETRQIMRQDRIQFKKGLREVVLKRNKLGNIFAKVLQNCLKYDKYLKVIDISQNTIDGESLRSLIRYALVENTSLVQFDA